MLVPLTYYEAEQRWADLGYGSLEESCNFQYSSQPLYTCRHWDTDTRLCSVYDQRPSLCADFPYGESCHHKGCDYRKDIDYLVQLAKAAAEALAPAIVE